MERRAVGWLRHLVMICLAGTICLASVEVRADASFAETWRAAENGDLKAQYKLGVMYDNGENGVTQDKKQAISWFLKAAKQGYAPAQSVIGVKYQYGDAIKQDLTQAVYWFTQSAEQGFVYAQVALGKLYMAGLGVPASDELAASWFRKAADQGYDDGQYHLALAYGTGTGVQLDIEKAFDLMNKAAAQGHEEARNALQKFKQILK